jgi:hypothetical protein
MTMNKLTGTVKIFGTKLYSGCGHGAVKGFDTCPRCRIKELETTAKNYSQIAADYEHKHSELVSAVKEIHSLLLNSPELNMANYTEDEISELNNSVTHIYRKVSDALEQQTDDD